MSVQIDVVQGTLEGKLCSYKGKLYYSFEGIPYAKPPTGKLRFRVSVNLSLLLINILLISAINKNTTNEIILRGLMFPIPQRNWN